MNLLERKNGIGGSDCAAVLGLSKWKTPYQVWQEKKDPEPKDIDNEFMWWGRALEPVIIRKYEEQTGNKVELLEDAQGEQQTITNPDFPWLYAHVDGVIRNKRLILEAKTTRYFRDNEWGETGTDSIPTSYLIQCAHYCLVLSHILDVQGVDIAALGSTSDFRIYHYRRNLNLEKLIIEKTQEFWELNVLGDIPPEITHSDDLGDIFNNCTDTPIVADGTIADKYDALINIRKQISELDEQKEAIESDLKIYMKENNELIDTSGRVLATWKASTSKTLDTKALKSSTIDLTPYYIEKQKRTFLIKKTEE